GRLNHPLHFFLDFLLYPTTTQTNHPSGPFIYYARNVPSIPILPRPIPHKPPSFSFFQQL
ncbi:hypothetical protein SK128_015076, partial [Halocaridina rubra]